MLPLIRGIIVHTQLKHGTFPGGRELEKWDFTRLSLKLLDRFVANEEALANSFAEVDGLCRCFMTTFFKGTGRWVNK